MGAITSANLAAYLKRYYVKDGKFLSLFLKDSAFLGAIDKDEKAGGEVCRTPINYLPPGGGGNTYSTAVANHTPGKYDKFDFGWVNKYQPIYITDDAIRDSRGDAMAIASVIDTEVDGAMMNHRAAISAAIQVGPGNMLGQCASGATGTTITLSRKSDVIKFKVGDIVVACSANGDASGDTQRTGSQTLTAVDYVAGTLTGGSNWNSAITSFANNDYLFLSGSFKGNVAGVAGWVPLTAPTSGDSFGGVDRSAYPQLLAGSVYDGSGETHRTALNSACAHMQHMGGAVPTHYFCNPLDLVTLVNAAETAQGATTIPAKGPGGRVLDVGYAAINLACAAGVIKVVSDRWIPQGYPFLTDLSSWFLKSVGPLLELQNFDGLTFRRAVVANGDSWEAMIKTRYGLSCNRPFASCRIKLATT
jgi:hypothetical protein